MSYRPPLIDSQLTFDVFQYVNRAGKFNCVTQRDIKRSVVTGQPLSYALDVLATRGLINLASEENEYPKLYVSADVPDDVVKQNFSPELLEKAMEVSFNDWRDAASIFLDDMSDFYNHVFILAFRRDKPVHEIAVETNRPTWFIESIVNHLSAIGETIANSLDKELES